MLKIIGLGSTLRGDDGVGPCVVQALRSGYEFGGEVEVEDLGAPGLELVHSITGVDAVILVDAVNDGAPPGTVTAYRNREITRIGAAARTGPHAPELAESLALAEMSGGAPKHLLLIGVSGSNYEMGETMSAAVRAAVPEAVEMTLRELRELGVAYQPREQAGA